MRDRRQIQPTETQQRNALTSFWARYQEITRDVKRGFLAEWTVTIAMLLFATTSLAQAFVIPSASMEDSLLTGDHVIVDKLVYSPPGEISKSLLPYREPRRGDIIVLRYPPDITKDYVKRAIGLPGDRVKLVGKKLWLNGHFPDEPYAKHVFPDIDSYRDNFPNAPPDQRVMPRAIAMLQRDVVNGELVVPPGFIFAMGDNRDNSEDSRYWGLVPRDNIEGTPLVIYWSYDATTEELMNGNIGVDHMVDVVTHFFTKTRWSRTFRLVHGYPLQ
jgi:signal peptidase I